MIRCAIWSTTPYVFALAVLVCCSLLEVARADNIDFYSGDFTLDGGPGFVPGQMTVGTVANYTSGTLNFEFQFSGNITDFQETAWCGDDCPQYFTGNINSGTVSFSGFDQSGQNPNYNFTGIITPGGSLTGEIVCDLQGCAYDDNFNINFHSTSGTNGWMSSGQLSWMGGNDGSGGEGIGGLNLQTSTATTAEPSTFLLLGSALVGLAGYRRQRRTTP